MKIEKEFLNKCEKGDRRAQFQLYRSCYSVLMSVCARYERNEEDAKGLLNLGFLKIINNLEKYKIEVPFEAWIRKIMINTVIDEYRKAKKEREMMAYTDFEEGGYENLFKEESAVLEDMKTEEIQEMMDSLPPVSKQVFNLFAIDGYSHKEICEMLDISEGTSKWHVSTARKTLKDLIQQAVNSAKMLVL